MNNVIEEQEDKESRKAKRIAFTPSSSSSILYTLRAASQNIRNEKMFRKHTIHDMLNDDSQLFYMVSSFPYNNKQLAMQNSIIEKGRPLIERIYEREEDLEQIQMTMMV